MSHEYGNWNRVIICIIIIICEMRRECIFISFFIFMIYWQHDDIQCSIYISLHLSKHRVCAPCRTGSLGYRSLPRFCFTWENICARMDIIFSLTLYNTGDRSLWVFPLHVYIVTYLCSASLNRIINDTISLIVWHRSYWVI